MKNLEGRYIKYLKGNWGTGNYPIGSFHLLDEGCFSSFWVIDCNGNRKFCSLVERIRDGDFELMPEGFIPNQQLTYILF